MTEAKHGECVLLPHRSMGATCCSSEETELALPRVKMLQRDETREVETINILYMMINLFILLYDE